MTDLRTAAQQALEALERIDQADNDCDFLNPSQCYQLDEAMTALRAALAEPQTTHSEECYKWHHKCAIARIERKAEPVQEPVAWMHTNGVGHVYFRKKPQDKVFNPRPVYLKDEHE